MRVFHFSSSQSALIFSHFSVFLFLSPVGLTDRSVAVWIGVSVFGILLVSLIVTMLYKKKQR